MQHPFTDALSMQNLGAWHLCLQTAHSCVGPSLHTCELVAQVSGLATRAARDLRAAKSTDRVEACACPFNHMPQAPCQATCFDHAVSCHPGYVQHLHPQGSPTEIAYAPALPEICPLNGPLGWDPAAASDGGERTEGGCVTVVGWSDCIKSYKKASCSEEQQQHAVLEPPVPLNWL
jgi:hypothetical protein